MSSTDSQQSNALSLTFEVIQIWKSSSVMKFLLPVSKWQYKWLCSWTDSDGSTVFSIYKNSAFDMLRLVLSSWQLAQKNPLFPSLNFCTVSFSYLSSSQVLTALKNSRSSGQLIFPSLFLSRWSNRALASSCSIFMPPPSMADQNSDLVRSWLLFESKTLNSVDRVTP